MNELVVKWRNPDSGEWSDLPSGDLASHSLESVCHMLGRKGVEVVAKQDDEFIVNSDHLRSQYLRKKHRVRLFSDVLRGSDQSVLSQSFATVGFGG